MDDRNLNFLFFGDQFIYITQSAAQFIIFLEKFQGSVSIQKFIFGLLQQTKVSFLRTLYSEIKNLHACEANDCEEPK